MAKRRGLRSSNDAKAWKCRACGTINRPTKHLFFKLPAFHCTNSDCGKKFCGSFKFCLGEINAQEKKVIGEVQDQGENPLCVAFAYSKAVEIMERVSSLSKGMDPDLVQCIDPFELHKKFEDKFPEVLSANCLTRDYGLHRVLHTALILRSEGITKDKDLAATASPPFVPFPCQAREVKEAMSGNRYVASDVSTIPRDDFQTICQNLAEGIPMVATYIPGKRRSLLRYCQIYKSPRSKSGEKQLQAQIGHAVVLIGAGMKRGRLFFYFLNSWGEKFCPRKNNQGEILTGGIGKLREDDLTKNVVRLSPPGETGGTRRLEDQFQLEISNPNYLLMMATRNQYSEMMMRKLRQKYLQEFRKDGLDDHIFRDDEAWFDLCVGIEGHKELEQAVSKWKEEVAQMRI
uniref:Peptidase C1A papain C-terminal domain-containing protein n=1 Tax=Oryza punctata TaxID=4537 RepID=A0A0E0M533_ORYPU